jgi:hypothetical protein
LEPKGEGRIAPQVGEIDHLIAVLREQLVEKAKLGHVEVFFDQNTDLAFARFTNDAAQWYGGGSGFGHGAIPFVGRSSVMD